ncbi:MAG TPA: ATP-binding protein, partial [Tepidisphaeraceae bacterium]
GVAVVDAKEMSVAQWAFDHDQPAGRGTATLPAASGTYVPLRGPRGVAGVLGVAAGATDADPSPQRRQLIEAFAALTALAVERANLVDEAKAAWEQVEAEFLRNTLLAGVSHDLRTPLAGIVGAATALAEDNGAMAPAARQEMLDTLVGEAERLERLINNLLDMTRMEAGGLSLRKEWTPIEETIGAALHHLDRRLVGRAVTTHVPPGLPLVHIDAGAIEQVLLNLVDNTIEYTPSAALIEITARLAGNALTVEVADRGPGLPAGAEERVFEKFFRAPASQGQPNRGVGLGLPICRGIVEAHGGSIHATNRPGGGAVFTFTLPVGGTPPAVDASA